MLTAAFALGVAEVLASFIDDQASPLVAVGNAAIDATPEWLKSFAIRTFGSNDKRALMVGMIAVIAVLAVVPDGPGSRRCHRCVRSTDRERVVRDPVDRRCVRCLIRPAMAAAGRAAADRVTRHGDHERRAT